MNRDLPNKLLNSPLVEAVVEIRFEPTLEGLGDILPGVLYSLLKAEYPTVATLPLAHVPRPMRDQTPLFRYQPSHRLGGLTDIVQVGDRVIGLNIREYKGWNVLREKSVELIKALRATGFVKEIERFSLKYTNVINLAGSPSQLSLVNLKVEVADYVPREFGFQLRYEVVKGKYLSIIQISPNTQAKTEMKEVTGLLLDIDTMRDKPGDEFWASPTSHLDEAHIISKTHFFSLLTPEAINAMQPV